MNKQFSFYIPLCKFNPQVRVSQPSRHPAQKERNISAQNCSQMAEHSDLSPRGLILKATRLEKVLL